MTVLWTCRECRFETCDAHAAFLHRGKEGEAQHHVFCEPVAEPQNGIEREMTALKAEEMEPCATTT